MVRRASDRSFNAKLMAEFDDSELIRGSESSDQADLKFLCGASSRLVHATEEQSKKCVSMEAMLMEIKNTLLQISNQLGIRPIDNESSQHVPPIEMPKSDPYVHDDSMEALLREMKQAPSIEMPEFDASNVSDWLSKVERSFRVRRYSDLDKLNLVAFRLEGAVLNWFNWEMTRSEFHSWDEFRRRLFLRFAATPEASSETVTESLEPRASCQVPVSSLEPGLSFSNESLVVSEARPSEIVSNNRVHSQSVLECVKNKANAYQMFDKTSLHKERLKPKNKRKLSLSLKTWMFKFKNKLLQRKSTSKRRKSLDVKSFTVEEIAWLMRDSKEIYRSYVDKEFKAVVTGCGKQLFDRFQIVDGTSKLAVSDALDSNIIKYISSSSRVTFGYKWKEHNSRYWRRMRQPHISKLLCSQREMFLLEQAKDAHGDCLICGVVKFHLKHKWRFRLLQSFSRLILWALVSLCFRKAYALSELLKDSNNGTAESLMAAEKFYRKVQPLFWLQISSENYLMVLEFENKKQLLGYKTRMFKYKAPLRRGQQYFAQEVPMQMVVDWLRKAAHILGLTHPFRPGLAIGVPPALIAGTLLVPENFWMFSKVFVQLYPSSKLEDKLVFEGGSIDTTLQAYHRKNKKRMAVEVDKGQDIHIQRKTRVDSEGLTSKEASGRDGGFAVGSRESE